MNHIIRKLIGVFAIRTNRKKEYISEDPIKELIMYEDLKFATTRMMDTNKVKLETMDGKVFYSNKISLKRLADSSQIPFCFLEKDLLVNVLSISGLRGSVVFLGEEKFRVSTKYRKTLLFELKKYYEI